MIAFYKYIVEYSNGIYYRKDRKQEVYFALDAEDLAEQFFADHFNVDYEIVYKEAVKAID